MIPCNALGDVLVMKIATKGLHLMQEESHHPAENHLKTLGPLSRNIQASKKRSLCTGEVGQTEDEAHFSPAILP